MGSYSLIRLYNGEPVPYSEGQLRLDILPAKAPIGYLPDDFLAGYDVFRLKSTPEPESGITETAKLEDKPIFANGVWAQVWKVEHLPQSQAESNVRAKRDGLLQETDWLVIKAYERNENIPAEWETYRQALRDITSQAGFPYSVAWPIKPE